MPVASKTETRFMKRGRQRIVWEVAMSCLALAVKFHRDFLKPLTPICSSSFLVVAPVAMTHDDFELSQKDVLEVFSYKIWDVTPGPFLEEIWNSLPNLRRLLAFPEGWTLAQYSAWRRLNACALEGEMFQFPISLLSAAALIEGTVDSLMAYYRSDVDEEHSEEEEERKENRARLAVTGIVEDVRDLLLVPKNDLHRCRLWIQEMASIDD